MYVHCIPPPLYDETGAERVKGNPAWVSACGHQNLPIQTLDRQTEEWSVHSKKWTKTAGGGGRKRMEREVQRSRGRRSRTGESERVE